jgi:hypothetical protein
MGIKMSKTDSIKRLKDQVRECLEENPETRNSDRSLAIAVLQKFYDIGETMTMQQFFDVPNFEGIARCRRKFQEAGFYPPTDRKIALERGWLQEDWQKAMGYNPLQKDPDDFFGHAKIDRMMQ